MSSEPVSREEFDSLKAEIASLKEAITQLAKRTGQEGIPEEHLHCIAAAVAVYLGKRATIRYVRKAADRGDSWRTQGRASVSGSHQLPKVKGW
jgi:hypothetical protein